MTRRAAADVLSSGVLHCDVTTTDLLNAEHIHGKSVAALK